MQQIINGIEYMENAQGALVPIETIDPVDLLRDETVREIVGSFKAVQPQIKEAKASALQTISSFCDISVEQYGVKRPGGIKGNVQLISFDGKYKVERAIAERITFDERLQAAKLLIDECLRDWASTSNANLAAVVADAFRVDKKGNINTGAILGLRKHKFDDERWQQAMQAINDSITVTDSCVYVRAYERDAHGAYQPIPLDIAAV